MEVYHMLLVFFPIALLNTAFLFVVIRALSDGSLAMTLEKSIVPLIFLGLLTGAAAYVLGLLAWPFSALTATPLGRNHLILATWTMAYWTVLLVFAWRLGEDLWRGAIRWVMLGLTALGAALLLITGTLGGSVAHNPSGISDVVRFLGWDTYTTFYVPNFILLLLIAASVALLALAVWDRRRRQTAVGVGEDDRHQSGGKVGHGGQRP